MQQACLSTHVTNVCNLGVQHSFDAMAKYQHWLEWSDVTVLCTNAMLLQLPIYTCFQQHHIMVLHYTPVPTLINNVLKIHFIGCAIATCTPCQPIKLTNNKN